MRFLRPVAILATAVLAVSGAASTAQTVQTAHRRTTAAAPAPAASVPQMVAAANAERPLLKAIYQAPTDQSIADKHPRSRIGTMVLAAKQYELHPAASGSAVLAALPRTGAEMEALRQFCAADTDLAGLERYFYGAAIEAVSHHPQSLPAVLHVASSYHAAEYADVDKTGDWYCSELSKVHGAMPQQYDHAVLQVPLEDRAYLAQCGAGS